MHSHIDTLVYALDKIHELFVIKLSYRYVMVCGDGEMVELLYKIKSDYSVKIEWLHMLGSWHLIKDYLHVFLKEYQNTVLRSLLSKMMTLGNVDSIIGCKVWWKSHNYAIWMLSAIIREFVEKFIQSSPPDCHQTIKALTEQCEKTVDCIRNEKLSQECIDNFLTELKSMRTIFKKLSNHLRDFEKNGCANDDQFALFFDIIEDFLPYSIYIAIRSSNWELRISALKIMAPRFMRSGAVTSKWLVLRYLADIKSYPSKIIERMGSGGWVSALQDGKGVTLARDKFHERTASNDIQLILPKRLTEKNMQVSCQYVTYGASAKRNLILSRKRGKRIY